VSSSYRCISAAVDGGRLHGGEWNPSGATTVVAVHGITANHRTFAPLAEALPRHRLLAPDPGRGASSTLPGPWGIDRHAEDVAGLTTASALGPVVVVGHSMGGFVAAALVRRLPDLVSGLVLVDGGLPFPPPPQGIDVDQAIALTLGPALQRLQRTFPSRDAYHRFWRAHPALKEAWSDAIADYVDYDLVGTPPELRSSVSSPAVLQDARDQIQDPDAADLLGGFSGPARLLVVSRGLLDQPPGLYPQEELVRWRSRVPSLTIDEVPQLNHYTIMLHPYGAARVAAAVRTLS
jgi:lipase